MIKISAVTASIKLALIGGAALTTLAPTSFAYAQEDSAEEYEKIAVVGSRGAPRSINDSPVPVDIIGGDELAKNGSSDMLDMLTAAVPSFNVRAQPISDAASLIRPVNLRGLPSDSTLVLLNGKRRHRASVIAFQGGGVNDGAQGPDISVIPSVAIKQVEVLRDGAAAQYGSDAIAGVMNFVLKDDAEGGSISVRQGEYFEGDGASTIVDANIGLPLAETGFVNLSMQYKNADATSRSVQRPDAAGLIAAGNTEVNDPAQIWGNPEIKDDLSLFANLGFDIDGSTKAYAFGNYSSREVTGGFYYRNPHNRGNVYSTDGGETLLVGAVNGDQSSCAVVPANVPNVLNTQAYADMVADPNCFSMNMIDGYAGGYTPQFGGEIVDMSFVGGVKGEFGEWSYDASASFGNNKATFNLQNTLNPSLGLASPSDFDTGAYEQTETSVGIDLVRSFDLGFSGDVNFATGAEWRNETFDITAGEEASWIAGEYADQGFNIGSHGFKGFGPEAAGSNSRSNIALYVDAEAFVTEDLLLGSAIRFEDYSTFGTTLDYKLTAQYSLNDEVSIRGSHSTGFRAPTVGQANVVNTQTSIVNGDLIQTFIAPPTDPLSSFYGGKELEPEESVSFAFGGVYDNDGLLVTVDYYNIAVTGRLAQSSQIEVESADYTALEALGVQNPELISAVTYYANDFDTTTQGLDIIANYSMDMFDGVTSVNLAYNWNETTVDSFNPDTVDEGKVRRLENGMPDHRATFTVSQNWDAVNMFVRANFFGEYYATHADDTSDWGSETADSAMTFDAEVSYQVNDALKLALGGSNIFDQEAQKLNDQAYSVLGAIYYESGPFDYNGGSYYLKAQYSF